MRSVRSYNIVIENAPDWCVYTVEFDLTRSAAKEACEHYRDLGLDARVVLSEDDD